MRNINVIGAAVITAFGGSISVAYATNGDQMLGVTATQWGMAGAIVAAPQDAGTVLTNPAGLATLDIEDVRVDMGFGFLNPPRKVNGVESDSNYYLIPSGAMAFRIDDKLTFGMGMAGLSGMGVDFNDAAPNAPGNQNVVTTKQFYKIAPGFGYQINDKLSWGAALNIDYQSLAMDIGQTNTHLPQNQAYGYGASFGLIYKTSDEIQLGFAYISRQYMDEFRWNTTNGPVTMTMDAAPQTSLGVAYTPSSDLLIEADIKYIAFSDVMDKVNMHTPGGTTVINFGWEDQIVYSLGVQKQLSKKTTVRFGLNYGESPIGPEDVDSNVGSLAIVESHVSAGFTRQVGKRVSVSASYVHGFHNKLTSSSGSGTTIELEQNIVNMQISYKM